MSAPRYYARFAGKEGFEDRYEVVDGDTGQPMSARAPYHEANDEAGKRNDGTFGQMEPMMGWLSALNFDFVNVDPEDLEQHAHG